jgi:ketosteroid isomerase-like protein
MSEIDTSARNEVVALATEWDRSMIENDADAIGRYMAEDWIIVGSDGSVGDKAAFLALVRSGVLTHDVMTSEDMHVRIYGDTAVTVSRGVSGGTYQGRQFREVERVTCVFVRQERRWRCVLTHLSRLADSHAADE